MRIRKCYIFIAGLLTMILCAALYSQVDIYHYSSGTIAKMRSGASTQKKQYSKSRLQKALYYHKNKKNWKKSIPFYRASIKAYPTAKAYYELGNAHMNLREYTKAVNAYKQAVVLDYKKTHLAYYNIACCYSLQKNRNRALDYLEKAFQYGYYSFRYTAVDKDMAYARKTARYNKLIKQYNNTNQLNRLLVGWWYGAPVIAERSPDSWQFKGNGRFTYRYDAGQTVNRKVSMSGTWRVRGNVLYLYVTKRKDRVGGRIENSDIHPGEKIISGAKVVARTVRPAQRLRKSVSHVVFDDKFQLGKKRPNVVIGGKRFWKVR